MKQGGPPGLGYVPALDGLRGTFLIAVVLFHGRWGFPGALVTMTGFFVLSGFLIATVLLAEHEASGRIDLKKFYVARARRLLPASLLAIVAVAVLWNVFDLRSPGAVDPQVVQDRTNGEVLSAVYYGYNWYQLAGPDWVGFQILGGPPAEQPEHGPLAHFWSLSLEEQFYLGFPLVALGALALIRRRSVLLGATVALTAVLLAIQPTLGDLRIGVDLEALARMDRIYVGTDVRMAEVLVGVAMAIALRWPTVHRWVTTSRVLEVAGLAAFALTAYLIFESTIISAWLYNRGFFVLGLVYAVLIASLLRPASLLAVVLDNPVLMWLGKRSYGMYVYHYPIMRLIDTDTTDLGRWPLLAAQVALTLVAGAVSYTFLEEPIRRGRRPAAPWWLGAAGVVALVGSTTVLAVAPL